MNLKYFLLFLFFISLVFIPISCDIKNPVEGLTVRVKNIPRTTMVRVEFIEQNTGLLVTTPFTIRFDGRNKNDVISDVNEPITQLIVKNGVAYFAIKDNIQPTPNSPVEIVVIVNSPQHLTTSQKLIISEKGTNGFVINMLKLSGTLPNGITTREQSFGNISTSSGITSIVQANSGGTLSARLIVNPGTILRDANGNVLTGNVSTQITYFDATRSSAIPSFPGGFLVNTNTSGNGGFVTAGFASINMFVGNTPVETFSQPVTIQIDVNNNVRNPITGTNVRPGDQIPMWSYNENNGTWRFEGNYTVQSRISSGGSEELFVEKNDVTHLSWYNLDWFFNSCAISSTINLVGGCWNFLYWLVEYQNGQGYIGSGYVTSSDPSLTFIYAPQNIPVRVLVFTSYLNLWNYCYTGNLSLAVGSLNINNLCQGPTQIFNLQVSTNVSGQNINVTVRGVCPNGNILDQGTLDIEIFKDGFWQYAGRIINGQITLKCLQIGQTYQFRAYYNGQYYTQSATITSANMLVEIPLPGDISFCN
jgi:hypothetical protein